MSRLRSHKFMVEVKIPLGTRKSAELRLLSIFANRQPDGCLIHIKKLHRTKQPKMNQPTRECRRIQKQPRRFWAVLYEMGGRLDGDIYATPEDAQDRVSGMRCPHEIVCVTETPPEKSPAELAWEKYNEGGCEIECDKRIFVAGYEAGRAAK